MALLKLSSVIEELALQLATPVPVPEILLYVIPVDLVTGYVLTASFVGSELSFPTVELVTVSEPVGFASDAALPSAAKLWVTAVNNPKGLI